MNATNGKEEEAEGATPKKTCFVVCPIGSDTSPERKHSNQVYKHIITPVLEAAGFDRPLRADMISEGGNISRQIINHIIEDDLVIADLTGRNPNVYYELAIRHCVAKPFIQLITVGENIPFDISQQRTIFFDRTDLDNVEATKVQLALQVTNAMVKGAKMDSPIGAALDFEKLKSGSGVEQMISSLIERVDDIGRQVKRPLTDEQRLAALERSLGPLPARKPGGFAFGEDGLFRGVKSDPFEGMSLAEMQRLFAMMKAKIDARKQGQAGMTMEEFLNHDGGGNDEG